MPETDMTITEATSVLTGIVSKLRAAQRLEEALKVVRAIDQLSHEAEGRKGQLEEDVEKLSNRLKLIDQEIIKAEAEQSSHLGEFTLQTKAAKATLAKANAEAERVLMELEESSIARSSELAEAFKLEMDDLGGRVSEKKAELEAVDKF